MSSPLGRAQATAQVMADRLGLSVQVLDDLVELHHGEYAGLTSAELAERPDWSARATDKYHWRFPGGESYRDADARAAGVIGYVIKVAAMRPLLVSHEMIGRMLIKNLLGTTPDEALATGQPHGTVYRYNVEDRTLTSL